MANKLRTGAWNLSDLKKPTAKAPTVFSCFHCGGGSSMGYKLAGFNVLGGVEIDPQMMELYKTNHNPKHSFLMGVEDFNKIPNDELPQELFELDVLDGSPPCSSFSTNGKREKKWGKASKFREGQAVQVLDDLFFHFIATAKKLQPKVVVAENVKGLILGNARGYVREIFKAFRDAGYVAQLFLLNSSRMGVPQARERTFFIARREEQSAITMKFDEQPISIEQAMEGLSAIGKPVPPSVARLYCEVPIGKSFDKARSNLRKNFFSWVKLNPKLPSPTLTSNGDLVHWLAPNHLNGKAAIRIQSFPDDYNFLKYDPLYVCGMSVPPFMMQRVASEVRSQLLKDKP
tara:strand:+ start:3123 stop:4157 length:1035 start_codon:yes stop_codon:yes gene_type:complete